LPSSISIVDDAQRHTDQEKLLHADNKAC